VRGQDINGSERLNLMLNSIIRLVGGDPNRRDIERYIGRVDQINALEEQFRALDDDALRALTPAYRARLAAGETADDLLPEAFAAVREAAQRTIGLRPYDVQLIGGMVLHEGRVAEMRTGEGKTLVASLPLYLNALAGEGAHLVTVNDYLARRDARWMGAIYHALGLSVGVLQEASRTDNARKAFVYDPERTSNQEDAHQLRLVDRRQAYAADITYGTNHEFGFDYLRDNLALRRAERVQRGRYFAIVDEVDNILIDEARTPLIISGPAAEEQTEYKRMATVVRQLKEADYELNERDRTVVLTAVGESHAEEILGLALSDPDRPEDITPEQARLIGHLQQALRAELLFRRNREYLVQGGQVVIVDEFTGRLMHGRRWSDGLHQAVEAKEGLEVQPENVTYATITLQNYFRLYGKLGGMTGTALTEAEEFNKIYKLDVVPIPTNLEFIARRPQGELVEVPYREEGNRFSHFARRSDPATPIFWRRKDFRDLIYRTEEAKFRSVCEEILRMHVLGRPVLVGTISVERSEILSERLRTEALRKLAITLLVRDAWFRANNMQEDGRQVKDLEPLVVPLGELTPAALRLLAKPLDLNLNPEEAANLDRLLALLQLPDENRPRLLQALQRGIPHQVLNAKKHAEESQIIAGAGAFGAVTIATNMAGRGVDIKLGGDLAEEVLAGVNRVLRRNGVDNPYDLTNADRLRLLADLTPDKIGVYASEIEFFRKHMAEEQRVRELGGLHVLGSERHEARRIDNQLRGRAARQGDPGSSRFFLSMEDELMRRFGGDQVSGLMASMRIDEAVPMESGLVSRLIEQAQTRVEGANFDVRKHLLEYDDVLNKQRARVYEMRERIFSKDDLAEDLREMLAEEIRRHIETAGQDEEGPWRLFGWLDEIQPSTRLTAGGVLPSFPVRVILDQLDGVPADRRREKLLELAGRALDEEAIHLVRALDRQIDQIAARAKAAERENREAVEMAIEGVEIAARETGEAIAPRALAEAAAAAGAIDADSVPRELLVPNRNHDLRRHLLEQAEAAAWTRAAAQASAWLQRRTGLPPDRAPSPEDDFTQSMEQLRARLDGALVDRRARILQEVGAQLDAAPPDALSDKSLAGSLIAISLRTQTFFDQRTHQRRAAATARFTWVFLSARLAAGESDRRSGKLADAVAAHLETALASMQGEWGVSLWNRFADGPASALPADFQAALRASALGEESLRALETTPLKDWPEDARRTGTAALGGRILMQAHRELLLGMIGQAWVEYLTSMEALRTSIGLEAYAQRDPLVQYKSRAYDLFQTLMQQVRAGVISRLYHMSLRAAPAAAAAGQAPESIPEEEPPAAKKKRHRH
jgi:preprotein translocase subunit SecA